MSGTIVAVTLLVIGLIVGPFAALRAVAHWRMRNLPPPLPESWRTRLHELLPMLRQLPPPLQARHDERVQRFVQGKRFVGCNGLDVTDDMRLVIAGYACLLALRPDARLFPAVRSILVYPGAFLVPVDEPDEFGLVDDDPQPRIGESWQGERVILSWDDVLAATQGDETNVVVHEFAHQLDDETPHTPGAPQLPDYTRWAQIMQHEYERLRRHRRPPVLDPYGAESPAEFFGVVTEAFIQRGAELAQHHAELYALLRDFYGYDTRDWRIGNAEFAPE